MSYRTKLLGHFHEKERKYCTCCFRSSSVILSLSFTIVREYWTLYPWEFQMVLPKLICDQYVLHLWQFKHYFSLVGLQLKHPHSLGMFRTSLFIWGYKINNFLQNFLPCWLFYFYVLNWLLTLSKLLPSNLFGNCLK